MLNDNSIERMKTERQQQCAADSTCSSFLRLTTLSLRLLLLLLLLLQLAVRTPLD